MTTDGHVTMVEPEQAETVSRHDMREAHLLDFRTPTLLSTMCGRVIDSDSVQRHGPRKPLCTVCQDRAATWGRT